MYRLGLDNLCIEHHRLHRSIYFCVSIYIFCSRSLVNSLLCVKLCTRLIKHKLEVCLQWRGTMAKRLCENPNAIISKCPYCQAACAEKDFQAYHECCTNYIFPPEIPIYKYVGHASDRAWYEIDAKPVKYPTGSNQTEPRTRYQQLATSANLTQAPKHSLNDWCAK